MLIPRGTTIDPEEFWGGRELLTFETRAGLCESGVVLRGEGVTPSEPSNSVRFGLNATWDALIASLIGSVGYSCFWSLRTTLVFCEAAVPVEEAV